MNSIKALTQALPRRASESNLTRAQHSDGSRTGQMVDALDLAASHATSRAMICLEKPRLAWPEDTSEACKPADNRIDYGRASKWLNAHSGEQRNTAKAILKNIQRIPEALFEKAICDTLSDLYKRVDSDRPLLPVCETFFGVLKSNHYLTIKARELVPALLEKGIFYPEYRGRNLSSWMPYKNQAINLMFIDDASYSGSQMFALIRSACITAEQCGVKPTHIYVALGCITRAARNKIVKAVDRYPPDERPHISFLGCPILLPSLTDLVAQDKLSHHELIQIKKRYDLKRDGRDTSDSTTLSYLPHKVPDSYSMLEGPVEGYTMGLGQYRFIPKTTPFYQDIPPELANEFGTSMRSI